MLLQAIKDAIANKKMICPQCNSPMKSFEKYAETLDAIRDGFNVQDLDSRGIRVTLICGNDGCAWKERTEFPSEYLRE